LSLRRPFPSALTTKIRAAAKLEELAQPPPCAIGIGE
jgi:hypothetical protein